MKIFRVLLISIFVFFSSLLNAEDSFHIEDNQKIFDLSGKWKFINHLSFQEDQPISKQNWSEAAIPGFWRSQGLLRTKIAYYYLPITISKEFLNKEIGFYSSGFLGTEEIYWNGRLIGGTGKIVLHKEDSSFSAKPNIYLIPSTIIRYNKPNELVIKVSDHLNMGGFPNTLYLGEYYRVNHFFIRTIVTKFGLSIVFFVFGLYFLLFFWDYKRDRSLLLFSLIMFLFSVFTISLDRYSFWIVDGFYCYYYMVGIPMTTLSVIYILLGSIVLSTGFTGSTTFSTLLSVLLGIVTVSSTASCSGVLDCFTSGPLISLLEIFALVLNKISPATNVVMSTKNRVKNFISNLILVWSF